MVLNPFQSLCVHCSIKSDLSCCVLLPLCPCPTEAQLKPPPAEPLQKLYKRSRIVAGRCGGAAAGVTWQEQMMPAGCGASLSSPHVIRQQRSRTACNVTDYQREGGRGRERGVKVETTRPLLQDVLRSRHRPGPK